MDETRIIAWIDGELSAEDAAEVEAAVAADPGLAALADRHRRLRARFTAGLAPLRGGPGPPPRPLHGGLRAAAGRSRSPAEAQAGARRPARGGARGTGPGRPEAGAAL